MDVRKLIKPVAVIIGVVVFTGGAAYGATGGNFILGRYNAASTQTLLTNSGAGPVLALSTKSGQPPLAVSAHAGKATNLNADKLDGMDSSQFARKSDIQQPTSTSFSRVRAESRFVDIDNDGALDPVLMAYAACPSGTQVSGGGVEVYTDYGLVLSVPQENGWVTATLAAAGEDETDLVSVAMCASSGQSTGGWVKSDSNQQIDPRHREQIQKALASR